MGASKCILPMLYCPPIAYFSLLAEYGENAIIDCSMRYDKRRKGTHRMDICDTHGLLKLTVPITLPQDITGRKILWSDVSISSHAHWWTVHLTALESAYGRTPFFQFYIDRFAPMLTDRYEHETVSLADFNRHFIREICDILLIPEPQFNMNPELEAEDSIDYRNHSFAECQQVREYYQIRSDKFGFMPGLSVLDLIFNMGPEAALIVRDR